METDDALHNPDVKTGKQNNGHDLSLSRRGMANLGCLAVLCAGFLTLLHVPLVLHFVKFIKYFPFSIGYPIITYVRKIHSTDSAFNLGGVNSTGQVSF